MRRFILALGVASFPTACGQSELDGLILGNGRMASDLALRLDADRENNAEPIEVVCFTVSDDSYQCRVYRTRRGEAIASVTTYAVRRNESYEWIATRTGGSASLPGEVAISP